MAIMPRNLLVVWGSMARALRFEKQSEGDLYHITARGSGRRVIFEDDIDRAKYLEALFAYTEESSGSLIAWCLMDNHVHLLFHLELHELSALMHRLHTKHSQSFNGRHGHIGPVFQGRYNCVPVKTDEQLIQTVRYIHLNPKDINGSKWQSYPWSSYRGYSDGLSHCKTDTVLELLGGRDEFERFHEEAVDVRMIQLDGYKKRLSDAEAVGILTSRLGPQFVDTLNGLPKSKRNSELAAAFHMGLSARQIERLTGIGRNIVTRAITSASNVD